MRMRCVDMFGSLVGQRFNRGIGRRAKQVASKRGLSGAPLFSDSGFRTCDAGDRSERVLHGAPNVDKSV